MFRSVRIAIMPEISVETGNRGTPEFKFQPLKGEDIRKLDQAAIKATSASISAKNSLRSKALWEAESKQREAVSTLADIMPREVAEKLVQALLDFRIGSSVTLKMKGETEFDGFTVSNVEIADVLK